MDGEDPALMIPDCGTKCPLEKLYELYKDWLPTQSSEKECKLREGEEKVENPLSYVLKIDRKNIPLQFIFYDE